MSDIISEESAEELGQKTVRRDLIVKVRVTAEERRQLHLMAEKQGLTLSDFLRKSAFNGEVRKITSEEFRNLSRLGSNFNQLVRLWHSTKEEPLGMEKVTAELFDYLREVYATQPKPKKSENDADR